MRSLILFSLLVSGLVVAKPFEKVFIVVLENTDLELAMKQPFLSEMAKKGALLENFYAAGRPSQPNYIAMVAGDMLGVTSNDNYDLSATNITDLLEEKGKSWKAYTEGYPGHCFQGKKYQKYVRKHLPMISFKNVSENPSRCGNIVNASEFTQDFLNKRVPDYVFYVPDMDNSGHDTDVAFADRWMKTAFKTVFEDADFLKDRLVVLTFDEGSPFNPKNRIYTVLYGKMVEPGIRVGTTYDFYSLLRTIEEAMGLNNLGRKDATAVAITDIWLR